jgi:hypothetical protein
MREKPKNKQCMRSFLLNSYQKYFDIPYIYTQCIYCNRDLQLIICEESKFTTIGDKQQEWKKKQMEKLTTAVWRLYSLSITCSEDMGQPNVGINLL